MLQSLPGLSDQISGNGERQSVIHLCRMFFYQDGEVFQSLGKFSFLPEQEGQVETGFFTRGVSSGQPPEFLQAALEITLIIEGDGSREIFLFGYVGCPFPAGGFSVSAFWK